MSYSWKVLLVFVSFFLCAWCGTIEAKAQTRLATWNIEHLGKPGEGCLIRDAEDYSVIREYVSKIGADIIAIQEIASVEAARHVFPADQYDLVISERVTDIDRPYCWGRPPNVLGDLRTSFAIKRRILYEFQ